MIGYLVWITKHNSQMEPKSTRILFDFNTIEPRAQEQKILFSGQYTIKKASILQSVSANLHKAVKASNTIKRS